MSEVNWAEQEIKVFKTKRGSTTYLSYLSWQLVHYSDPASKPLGWWTHKVVGWFAVPRRNTKRTRIACNTEAIAYEKE